MLLDDLLTVPDMLTMVPERKVYLPVKLFSWNCQVPVAETSPLLLTLSSVPPGLMFSPRNPVPSFPSQVPSIAKGLSSLFLHAVNARGSSNAMIAS